MCYTTPKAASYEGALQESGADSDPSEPEVVTTEDSGCHGASFLGVSDSMSVKRRVLSLEAKASILEAISKGEKKEDIATWFRMPQNSLSAILNSKDSIIDSLKKGTSDQQRRLKAATYEDINKAVFKCFVSTRAQNIPIGGAGSCGWLHRFKARHSIVGKSLSRESSLADATKFPAWIENAVPDILDRYDPVDVYNANETALFYQMLPKRTLALKGDSCHSGKNSKL
ncbi:hypothetical protein HPB50_023203 [Hyalomma asiaticum]|uniref:Uncharacterized protein n=1 Tax=Hyalomma asiaticum TaxID=266040 RepID=A0ACB7TPX4_HYAAI|nr:hypothetical protein HPB50_023203 [Hyalomma asiaticum]